jgi:hypothetical protein
MLRLGIGRIAPEPIVPLTTADGIFKRGVYGLKMW